MGDLLGVGFWVGQKKKRLELNWLEGKSKRMNGDYMVLGLALCHTPSPTRRVCVTNKQPITDIPYIFNSRIIIYCSDLSIDYLYPLD